MRTLLFLFCATFPLLARADDFLPDGAVRDHARIRELSAFMLPGEVELWQNASTESSPTYRTLNHEGGTKVRVLAVVGSGERHGRRGLWLRVMLTAPAYESGGELLGAYRAFLLFLPDGTPLFDFEE